MKNNNAFVEAGLEKQLNDFMNNGIKLNTGGHDWKFPVGFCTVLECKKCGAFMSVGSKIKIKECYADNT